MNESKERARGGRAAMLALAALGGLALLAGASGCVTEGYVPVPVAAVGVAVAPPEGAYDVYDPSLEGSVVVTPPVLAAPRPAPVEVAPRVRTPVVERQYEPAAPSMPARHWDAPAEMGPRIRTPYR